MNQNNNTQSKLNSSYITKRSQVNNSKVNLSHLRKLGKTMYPIVFKSLQYQKLLQRLQRVKYTNHINTTITIYTTQTKRTGGGKHTRISSGDESNRLARCRQRLCSGDSQVTCTHNNQKFHRRELTGLHGSDVPTRTLWKSNLVLVDIWRSEQEKTVVSPAWLPER